MFVPNKFKFKKYQKGKQNSHKISSSNFTIFKTPQTLVLKAIEFGNISSKQFKAFKQAVLKLIKKKGFLIFNLFPNIPVTKKPIEVRMGKGKGNVTHWVKKIKPGLKICEIQTNSRFLAQKALLYSKIRLPIKTKIIL